MGAVLIPVMILLVVIALAMVIRLAAKYYIKVAPNEVAIVSGSKHKMQVKIEDESGQTKTITRGYKLVTGGAFFQVPIRDRVEWMKLNVIQIPVQVINVPDKNGVLVSVKGIANIKVLSDQGSLALAVERFLGGGLEDVERVAKENLESNLRAVVGKMSVEELIADRTKLQGFILEEAVNDMSRMGLGVDLMNVQEISDDRGYIDALGKKKTAEIKRDAAIGEAEAQRDADIKSAEAKREGETAKAEADRDISNAERDRDETIAENNAKVRGKQARIEPIAQQAAAEEQKTLNIKNVEAEEARVEAETELQKKERARNEAELEASVIVKAEKDKEARIIAADAEREAAEREGEAKRITEEKIGQGAKARLTAEAAGRKEAADAKQKEMEAEAAGKEADLLAEATGIKERGLAEALAALEKAKAYEALGASGTLLMLLQMSPNAIEAIGNAVGNAITPAATAVGEGLGAIDELRLVDLGGGNGKDGGNLLGQFVKTPVEAIYTLLEKAKATGMAPQLKQIIEEKFGIDLSEAFSDAEAPAHVTEVVPEDVDEVEKTDPDDQEDVAPVEDDKE